METEQKDREVVALVPCRAGSQRVKEKNVRDFAGESLLKIKLRQLLAVPEISRIIVSTDDPKVREIAQAMGSEKIELHDRDPHYASSECTNEEMVRYFASEFSIGGHFLWTHVTSPFMDEKSYSRAIKEYFKALEQGHDSLVSVKKMQEYIWDENKKPVSYDPATENWPRTQTLKPLFIINSGIFLLPYSLMKERQDRVGENPAYFEVNNLEDLDIDWQEDFDMALLLWSHIGQNK